MHTGSASSAWRGAAAGLAAAALFGVSAPLAKLLLRDIPPVLLAGLLYSGAAAGLWLHRLAAPPTQEAPIGRGDWPKLAVLVAAGGVAGPVLMLLGLQRVSGVTGSLLLNLEAPFTMLLAVAVFQEQLGRLPALAAAVILGGAAVLQIEPGDVQFDVTGAALLAGACACWALDNNLTQRLSLRDPYAVARVKTLISGSIGLLIGLVILDQPAPAAPILGAALLLGSLSYGASVVLDVFALRWIGAAREAAYFATAPFVGAAASLGLLGDGLRLGEVGAMALMGLGVVLLTTERHAHVHAHAEVEHDHLHSHDAHHQHRHGAGDPSGEIHSHWHQHEPLVHEHQHFPDAHHRHKH